MTNAPSGPWCRAAAALATLALAASCAPADDESVGRAGDATGDRPPPEPPGVTDAVRAYCPTDAADVEARIDELLAASTLEAQTSWLHGAWIQPVDGAWALEGDASVPLPGLRMLDGPRGLGKGSGRAGTSFPVAILRGATWDPALEARVGAAIARELRAVGANVLLAPTMNLLRHPRWGRAQETYAEDTVLLGALAVGFIRGVQSEGVLATAKHFAAYSVEDGRHSLDVRLDDRTLRELYLPHFRRAVEDAGVAAVMTSYNRVNGAYADQSAFLLRDVLKGEWGFAGFVVSDWVYGTHGGPESLRAGLDVEMPIGAEFADLSAAVERGELDRRFVADAFRRVARAQLCFELEGAAVDDLPPADGGSPGASGESALGSAEHLALAREVARSGVVLLRNEPVSGAAPDGRALPLARGVQLVLAGAAGQAALGDTGSSDVTPTGVVTLREAADEVASVTDVGSTVEAGERALIEAADAVVVVVGPTAADEGEDFLGAGDRESLSLAASELALIDELTARSDRVIVVLQGGGPVLVEPFLDRVEAALYAGYPGQEGGHALVDVLFGDHSPSGRLPFSWPRSEDDLPPFERDGDVIDYGYLHGYRYLSANALEPRFPFGFGLGYTTFERSVLSVSATELRAGERVQVEVAVTNTGARAAADVVQLYVGTLGEGEPRAPRELRAFARVDLEPGERRTVTLELAVDDLRIWGGAERGYWLEPVEYVLELGSSATDVRPVAWLPVAGG